MIDASAMCQRNPKSQFFRTGKYVGSLTRLASFLRHFLFTHVIDANNRDNSMYGKILALKKSRGIGNGNEARVRLVSEPLLVYRITGKELFKT